MGVRFAETLEAVFSQPSQKLSGSFHRSLYDAGPVQERISPVYGPQQPSLPEYYESGRTAGGRLSAAAEWKRAVCAFDGDSVP